MYRVSTAMVYKYLLTRLEINGDVGHGIPYKDALLVLVPTSRHFNLVVLAAGRI